VINASEYSTLPCAIQCFRDWATPTYQASPVSIPSLDRRVQTNTLPLPEQHNHQNKGFSWEEIVILPYKKRPVIYP